MILLTVTNFVTVVVFTWIASLFFWLPASWFKPKLTLFSNRFKHRETDDNSSFPPGLAQPHAYSIGCGGIPCSRLSPEFPLLLPVQALWWRSQAPKTKPVKTLALQPASSYVCLLKYTAIPRSLLVPYGKNQAGAILTHSSQYRGEPAVLHSNTQCYSHHPTAGQVPSEDKLTGCLSLTMNLALLGICAAAQSNLARSIPWTRAGSSWIGKQYAADAQIQRSVY